MNLSQNTPFAKYAVPTAMLPAISSEASSCDFQEALQLHHLPVCASHNLLLPAAECSEIADSCHCDFNTLLMDTLARFSGCGERLELQIETGFRRICEFLEIERAAIWQCTNSDPDFILTHPYPVSRSADGPARSTQTLAPLSLPVGTKSAACFPWMSVQALAGKPFFFANPGQLPMEASIDMESLRRLGVRSGAMIPFLSNGKVLGVVSFALNRNEAKWPNGLAGSLKFVTQILAVGIIQAARRQEQKTALDAERRSAEESLAKSAEEVKQLKERLTAESAHLQSEIRVKQTHGQIIGNSAGIRRVLHLAERVAPVDCAVLLTGETGTGKELIAQEIHRLSSRRARPMVLVNCAALPAALVESELFGRERGAYTGALTAQFGRFQIADGSTIFLDEVGELPLEVQAKLLRVLQQGEFQRLGNPKTHKVNVRVVAATNRDLAEEVRRGKFREDLYYRLKVFPIELPPLRERVQDIPALVFAFIDEFSTRMGKKITKVPRIAMEKLERHSWPGNIRELRNVIEHSLIISTGDVLKLSVLGSDTIRSEEPITLAEVERKHIIKTLEATGWRIKGEHGAAQRLGLEPSTLYSRMQKLEIPNRRQKDEMSVGVVSALPETRHESFP